MTLLHDRVVLSLVNPSVLIGSFLVGILPYGSFRDVHKLFIVYFRNVNAYSLQRNLPKYCYFLERLTLMGKRNIHLAKFIILMMWNRLNNALHFCNAEMKNRTELNLGKIVNISNVYYISDS